MKLHTLTLNLKPNSDVKVSVSLPCVQLKEADGGAVVSLLVRMLQLYAPKIQTCLEKIWTNPVVGTCEFDQTIKNSINELKQELNLQHSGAVYAVECVQQIANALKFGKQPGSPSLPESGRAALKIAYDLGKVLYCLKDMQYLKPTFLYQDQGVWSVRGPYGRDTGHEAQVSIITPVSL